MIQIGWCAGIQQAGMLAESKLDYIECPLSSLPLEGNEGELAEQLARYAEADIPVRAMNLFAPGGMKLVGPDSQPDRFRRYAYRAGEAASRIGAEVVVLGSGGARKVPDTWERQRAEQQLLECLSIIAEEWRGTEVTLALEPLNRKETNLINSVSEAVRFASQINAPAVRVLADFYHMDEENEPLDTLVAYKDWIAHIHIADTGRLAPGTGVYPYDEFIATLAAIDYKGMISAECGRWPESDEALNDSIAFMAAMRERIADMARTKSSGHA
ncbi:sugar phosphate isomerase/epimerase [Paenibacillus sp. J5C_2022]|uniref:sugar phosphate isomerase/epimerase family protein n=1 Tax=Paenibacillus sp. J5C2022 TaxID=2977129 RepID=UPI0021D08471|nr:sugar phosphate isomerase/epimerase family protein [Paenibacillus sp. J5C2022]MCU6711301.1 sugar phosphate isomerase/epimerase [Paenibacillus sp. J5C2022]